MQKDFSLSQMSFDLKVPERNLSAYFNNDLNKTFGEWKNDKRIEYVVQLIEAGHAKVYTIEALSAAAGFQFCEAAVTVNGERGAAEGRAG